MARRAASRLATLITTAGWCGAVILLSAVSVSADSAPPYVPGDPVGVPSGPVKDVFIEHEDLSMDLTGVGASLPTLGASDERSAVVDARYTLRNDGAAQGVDLVFVTASIAVARSQVLFDGAPTASTTGPLGSVPASWMPPHGTPSLDGGPDIGYYVGKAVAITFHVEMGAGRHTMETRYNAVPAQTSSYNVPRSWQLAFVLSPARQWGGFGDLNVNVRIPTGWDAAVRPRLTREGGVLTGHFTGIPSDAIAITTRLPNPADPSNAGWVAGSMLVLASAVAIGWTLGPRIGWFALLLSPLFAIFLAVVVAITSSYHNALIPYDQESWADVKGNGLFVLIAVVLAFFAGFVIGALGLAVGTGAQRWSSSQTRRTSQ
jgi:hypothetical protein